MSIITDLRVSADIAQQWNAVRRIWGWNLVTPTGNGVMQHYVPDHAYNLPFVLAYAVLDQALGALVDQGTISCRSRRPPIGEKMEAARTAVKWQDYGLVSKGKDERDKLAHQAKLLPKKDAAIYVDAIEAELKGWGII